MKSKIVSCVYHVNHRLLSLFVKNRSLQQNCYKYCSNMPRSSTHVLTMQLTREKLKNKSTKYLGNTNVSLQILGSGTHGAPRCVYLTAGHISYIFNCGEGTQRLAYEHKYKLIKLEHIFVTSTSWNNLGGIPGMLLTVQEAGVPKVNIHGPKGTVELFDAIKKFVMLQALKVHEARCNESEPYKDSVMSVSYVPITKSSIQEKESIDIGKEEVDNINYYDYTINSNGKRIFDDAVEKESKTQKVEEKSGKTRISSAMSYICRLHPRAGTLSLEKCVEKGVKPGPLFGQLKAGRDITLPDGTVVLSKDVCSPTTPGPVFLIVECPLEDYLESFVNHPAFVQHQATATISNKNDVPYCIIHFTPQKVMDDPRYIDWMNKFDPNTRHIVVNEENKCMGTEAVYRHQYKLHLLHSEIFPLLSEESFKNEIRTNDLPIIHRPRTNHTIHLQPELKYDTKNEVSLHQEEYIKEAYEIEGFSEMLKDLQIKINIKERLFIGKEYPKIIMLGTGSSIPNKVRNTSGILLQVDKNHSMLLDCGEGTLGQIAKIYGKYTMDKIIKTIKAVYISHPHADHHIGLIGFLKERKKITQDPLYLFAPTYIAMWLRLYHIRFESILHQIKLIPNHEFFMDTHEPTNYKYKDMYETLNVQAVKTTYVKHCSHSFGISVTLNSGEKIVYSGDTMPCENLVKLGQNCNLLIHEATMEDDLAKEARMKLHSTTSQAIQAGKQMRSRFTLLTHFSQRYSVIPPLPNDDDNDSKLNNVGIAYDNMHISLPQLPLLPLMYPTLKLMFIKHYMEVEERAARRRMAINL